jgi:uncharacterized membrane protein SirB2
MAIVKSIHMAAALLSISVFMVRGVWMMRQSPQLQRKWVKIAPHANDTVLLLSAIVLAVQVQQYPLVDSWLTAKLLALLLYIGLGLVALRLGRSLKVRMAAFALALVTFFYIVGVALSRDVWAGLV